MSKFGPYLKRDFITHTRKVQNLFKRMVRNEESYLSEIHDVQFAWATVRAEFEKNRHVKDLRVARLLIEEGERRLAENLHPNPDRFIFSPGGLMFERELNFDDSHLDLWHPLEKAQYPYYFERRERMKKEYIQEWEAWDQEQEKLQKQQEQK
ncbi:Cs-pax a [Sarcoptes scabiei]|nr:Cs-pax a [Sarcoptes scabiei]